MARAADGCRVAVTGMGCVTAAGDSLPLTLAALDAGRRNLSPSPFPDITPPSPVFRCTDDLPDPEKGKGAAFLSRTARLAFAAALEALAQAGFPGGPPATLRVGVCIGTSVGASLHFFDYYRAWRGGETPSLESVRSYLRSNPSL
ncbi:MAG: beta-ketoacyl-[acyl-carrier-protein] synthase family protein, partial [Deltaproteobacteria bacterium]|nr:beta-ketoacyl-[acyl-carrier-protein] synthase family protein [Deltaproteobacteria bacterium]